MMNEFGGCEIFVVFFLGLVDGEVMVLGFEFEVIDLVGVNVIKLRVVFIVSVKCVLVDFLFMVSILVLWKVVLY